jgi:hypothetical protein
MPLDIYYREDVEAHILAGVVLTVVKYGDDRAFLDGALCAFQHQALSHIISWQDVVQKARAELGADLAPLLNSATVPLVEK